MKYNDPFFRTLCDVRTCQNQEQYIQMSMILTLLLLSLLPIWYKHTADWGRLEYDMRTYTTDSDLIA